MNSTKSNVENENMKLQDKKRNMLKKVAPSLGNLAISLEKGFQMPQEMLENGIAEIMRNHPLRMREIRKYALVAAEAPYTRNLIYRGDKFALVLMVWKPLKESCIHSHGNSKCWARLISGEIVENRFAWPQNEKDTPKILQQTHHTEDAIMYIDDALGLHSLNNVSDCYAYSLHCYSPAIDNCKYYSPKSQSMQDIHVTCHYFLGSKKNT